MIRRKDLYNKKEKEKTKKYNFQGKSARSRRWFDLDHKRFEENSMTHETDFYKILYQTKDRGDDTKTYQSFSVTIGNAKTTEKILFHPASSVLKYHQKKSNSCCLSSLASAFHSIGDDRAVTALVNHIEESWTIHTDKFRNIIHFANAIMTNRMNIKGEQRLIYNMKMWHKKDDFNILKKISEYVTLVQLMDSLGNMNHAINIVGYWIFDSNN